jgi:uncharacterized protein
MLGGRAGLVMWQASRVQLDATNLPTYARGCAVLGTGGGGDTGAPLLAALGAVADAGPVDVVSLDDLPDDALILPVAGWGAPTVSIEKLESGDEGIALRAVAERWFGRQVTALMVGEIGGGNGVTPIGWAARTGLPVVDADAMGRAFPEGDMSTMRIHGVSAAPAFFADDRGTTIIAHPPDARWLERIARHLVMAFGGSVAGADHVMEAAIARGATVRNSVPLALAIGEALEGAGLDGVLAVTRGVRLITGKVVDVERRTAEGFARGQVVVEGTGADAGRTVSIDVQNENLRAREDGRTLASVPDLITLADEVTGEAVPTERVRYGHRVAVLGLPCAPVWRTELGLEVGGPARFGYEGGYLPVEEADP